MELLTEHLILRTVTEADIKEIAGMWKYPETVSVEDAYKALEKMEQKDDSIDENLLKEAIEVSAQRF